MNDLMKMTIPLVIKIKQDNGGELCIEGDFTFPIWYGHLNDMMLDSIKKLGNKNTFLVGGKQS